jgi:nitrous oxidase accessory protein
MKRKWLAIGIILLFVGTCIVPAFAQTIEKPLPTSRGNWLYVGGNGPGNYTVIQDAIDNASNGDTVFVYNGTYYENVVIDKSINLIGEDRNSTIIDGGGSGDVVTIINDNTLLKNFTIQNGGYYNPFYALVKITSNNNTISNNTIIHAFHGIWLDNSDLNDVSGNYIILSLYGGICLKDHSEYNIISKNIIYDAGVGGGIQFEGSNNNTVIDNYVSDTDTGMDIGGSSINTIENNTFFNNFKGLYLTSSYNNLFNYNTIETNNDYGVFIYDSNNNFIYHNNFINNSINALDYGNNTWDDGYPSGGNYWDDYNGVDANGDGIGDTPYNISGGINQDHYPLMFPYGVTRLTITIQSSPFKVAMLIKNVGNFTAFNVEWTITIKGGFIFIGRNSSGKLLSPLQPGQEIMVKSRFFLLGLGKIEMTYAAWADNAPVVTAKMNGILLLFFFKIIGK